MPDSKNSKSSRTSKKPAKRKLRAKPRVKSRVGTHGISHGIFPLLTVIVGAALVSALAIWFLYSQNYLLYYGDAQAHLAIARRVVDSRTPGWEQIGTVWLPLPHVLMLPFVGNNFLWRTGLAGTIPSAFCFVIATGFLFGAARRAFHSTSAGFTAAALFALNPNMLYLQALPMTESVYFASLLGLLYFLIRFHHYPSVPTVMGASLAALAATMCRYEGWFLLPFVAIYIFWRAGTNRWIAALLFFLITAVGPLLWLWHNLWFCGNALEFYNGPYSPQSIQGGRDYPGKGDWMTALHFFQAAAVLNTGWPLAILGMIGAVASAARRTWIPLVILTLPMIFYVLNMHSGASPVFVPALYNDSYYNTRYGLALLPFAAFCTAGLVAGPWPKPIALICVLMSVIPWLAYPKPANWITWKESQVNSEVRRNWTSEAANYMKVHYKPRDGMLMPFSDVVGIPREAGIDLRETVHEGNGLLLDATLAKPLLFPQCRWAVAISGDHVSRRIAAWSRRGLYWDLVKTVEVKGSPPIEIYRRRSDLFRR